MKSIRKQLLATAAIVAFSGSAFAADMGLPAKAPAPAPIPYVGWQGFYVGGFIGAAHLNTTGTLSSAPYTEAEACSGGYYGFNIGSCSTTATGFTAGGQIGYDWQSRYFVYGVVADWSWTNLK